ncbi:hypothetical protein K2173_008867 [Erythroxylum novogranatense]|uniref:Folylpolyglutamate synthase n=1 Tax=Erythroxylum novogranatense TaxID=1862640 RepID=A0AAV8UBY7_9ROSI|nr:hypothetical protein K2173_008867 [Erythroxylum novogranatense]
MSPILIGRGTLLKCGIFEVSRFRKKEHQLWIITPWRFVYQPVVFAISNIARCQRHHSKTRGFTYQTMSSQVIEKTDSDAASKDMQELHVSTSYESAMQALSSLITRQKRGERGPVGGKYGKLERMDMYLKILDLEDPIAGLKIIHVAGTKGKGSTCTFCEAILRECGFKTGLFMSPHLMDVRERFRICGLDISEDKFLLYFWDCWNQLKEGITSDIPMPPLFQFLTILAFKIFVLEKVDVAIIEVGLGGKNDSTNVIKEPVVCGITSLGMDHTEALGNTLGQIASHKAGIFKPQIPAFTVPQASEAMDVLQERAHELEVPLQVVAPLNSVNLEGFTLSLSGDHQFINAGLAISLCKCWLQRTGNWDKLFQNMDKWESYLPDVFLRGLSTAYLPGRAQVVHDSFLQSYISPEVGENTCGDLIFYLDGAHSPESMEVCAKWFCDAIKIRKQSQSISSTLDLQIRKEIWANGYSHQGRGTFEDINKVSKQILLFNCMDVRDPEILLPRLVSSCASTGTYFSKAIFVPSMSSYNKVISGATINPSNMLSRDLSWQFKLQSLWEKIVHGIEVDPLLDQGIMDNINNLPPPEFLYEDASHCSIPDAHLACSTVIPSLPLAIKWLRDCVQEKPSLKIEVLVTGSLHLVGDVLKLLRR